MLPFDYSGPSLSLDSVHFVDSVQLESNPALSAKPELPQRSGGAEGAVVNPALSALSPAAAVLRLRVTPSTTLARRLDCVHCVDSVQLESNPALSAHPRRERVSFDAESREIDGTRHL